MQFACEVGIQVYIFPCIVHSIKSNFGASMATFNDSVASASSFISSIAVNTHAGFDWSGYQNIRLVTQNLDYLGITTVRDSLGSSPQANELVKTLAASGFKLDFTIGSNVAAAGAAGIADFIKSVVAIQKATPGSVIAVEGLNEANIYDFRYNGSSTMSAASAFQKAFYTAVKADSVLRDVAVYNTTLGYDSASDYRALGDLSTYSDYANSHAYVSTNASSLKTSLNVSLGLARQADHNSPTVITETGYTTLKATRDLGADESAQAKMILNTLVTAFRSGVEKTYLYELMDRTDDARDTDKEAHFGLFNNDGSPKLAATAIHNLTTILNDDGKGKSMPSGPLDYTLSNLPANSDSLVLTKSNGAYDLVVWASPKVWDNSADREFTNIMQPVKLQFISVAKTVVVYDPLTGTNPVATYNNVKEISLPISDHPLIVEVGGTGLIPKGVVTMLATMSMTANAFMSQIDDLKSSETVQKITLTDTNVIPVPSLETMRHMISADQSVLAKIAGDYKFGVTQQTSSWLKSVVYDASGKLLSTTEAGIKNGFVVTQQTKFADGSVKVENFSGGAKINETLTYVNGVKEVFILNIKNQGYATEHSIYDKVGSLTLYERIHVDGTLAFSEARTGGTKTVSSFNDTGVITTKAVYLTDGSFSTYAYINGKISKVVAVAPDKSQVFTNFDIKNQTYTKEIQTIDKTGILIEVSRTHADGTMDYRYVRSKDGSTTTSTFDAAGSKIADVKVYTNGAKEIIKFALAGQPGAIQVESYNAAKAQTMVDLIKADGSHQITAKAAGLMLTGGEGADAAFMFGGDKFVFTGGRDTITNFHAIDGTADHDVLQISKSLAENFAALHVSQAGADTLVTINEHDALLLKSINVLSVGADDFLFM